MNPVKKILKKDVSKDLRVTCYKCGYERVSTAPSANKIRFKCPKCGSKSFEWAW